MPTAPSFKEHPMGPSTEGTQGREGKADDARFAQEITKLAEAIRDLAERPQRLDDDEGERRRLIQRVDFGYQALGTLMGRVSRGSAAQFDVPVFAARWDPREPVIVLDGLPDEVGWIELRNGLQAEILTVRRDRDQHDRPADADPETGHDSKPTARVHPKEFTPRDAIASTLGLRHPRGRVLALGPRIAAVPHYH
jgi:hypothetical protein